MQCKWDERKQNAQYDEREGEFPEFIANEMEVIGKIFHGLPRIMHKKAGDEEEYAHVERVNPVFQGIIPWRREICTAMTDDDEQQRDADPDVDQKQSSFNRTVVHCQADRIPWGRIRTRGSRRRAGRR